MNSGEESDIEKQLQVEKNKAIVVNNEVVEVNLFQNKVSIIDESVAQGMTLVPYDNSRLERADASSL